MKDRTKITIVAIVIILLLLLIGAYAMSGSKNDTNATPTPATAATVVPTPVPTGGTTAGTGTTTPTATPVPTPAATPTPTPAPAAKPTQDLRGWPLYDYHWSVPSTEVTTPAATPSPSPSPSPSPNPTGDTVEFAYPVGWMSNETGTDGIDHVDQYYSSDYGTGLYVLAISIPVVRTGDLTDALDVEVSGIYGTTVPNIDCPDSIHFDEGQSTADLIVDITVIAGRHKVADGWYREFDLTPDPANYNIGNNGKFNLWLDYSLDW